MNKHYNHKEVEAKWRKKWKEHRVSEPDIHGAKKPFYNLMMFPYPSAEGLHIGNVYAFVGSDVYGRFKKLQGYDVFEPIGFDAFGIHSENYAIKIHQHPIELLNRNIRHFREDQLKIIGNIFDWRHEVDTTRPEYYKWTQWIFLKLYEAGLAERREAPVNWCPSCKTVLADEQVEAGVCERCKTIVEKKQLKQWFFKITKYAQKLDENLEHIDWTKKTKLTQKNWIGRSEGIEIHFPVPNFSKILYSTTNIHKIQRIQKLYGKFLPDVEICSPEDLGISPIGVFEGSDLSQNAEAKARAYFRKTQYPILGSDVGFFVHGELTDPAFVKRKALEGHDESKLSQEEIAYFIIEYYKNIARKNGGKVDAYWKDVFVMIFPDGSVKKTESIREVILTDMSVGKIDIYVPLRSLYIVKRTNKYVNYQSEEDELYESQPMTNALRNLISSIKVFTTRVDTLFGAMYIVLAPEHEFIQKVKNNITNWNEVKKYIKASRVKNEIDRTDETKEKTGIELKGINAINPVNNEKLPVFVADYVLADYGTGAIMAVPAHDARDFAFAKKFGLPVKQVVAPFFSATSGPDAVKVDKPTVRRKTVYCLVKHWSEDKYLCLDWGKLNWHSGVIGGIEEGEKLSDAAIREVQEETGYKNVTFIKQLSGEIHNYFFAHHKNENRYALGYNVLLQIKNDEKEEPDPEQPKNHKASWINRKDMGAFLNLQNFQYAWNLINGESECFSEDGITINSDFLDDLKTSEAKERMLQWLEQNKCGKKQVRFRLHDWLISRQRYWGPPIPIIYCKQCGIVPVPKDQLPVLLPDMKNFEPDGSGKSPLARDESFVHTQCPKCSRSAMRETDVTDNFLDSAWYFFRYPSTDISDHAFDPKITKKWLPVDMYIGGHEHAVLHLMYTRFITMALHDFGYIDFSEPFKKFRVHGLIIKEGAKMSKSKGNVVNPDEYIEKFGADTLRMYLMFLGPLSHGGDFSDRGMYGIVRFLKKLWSFVDQYTKIDHGVVGTGLIQARNELIKKAAEDFEVLSYNTVVAKSMQYFHVLERNISNVTKEDIEALLFAMAPLAPHICEELWESLGNTTLIFESRFPKHDDKLAEKKTIEFVIQVNGRVRDRIQTSNSITEKEAFDLVSKSAKVQKFIGGKSIQRQVFVPKRLINIIV